ncbi:MAG: transaldolase [Actinomycetota bacterium]|jgi:transaldolase
MANTLAEISHAGVAVWLDDLSRERLQNNSLTDLIKHDSVVGVTTNPSIFSAAIGKSSLYREDIIANKTLSIEEIIMRLTTDDVRKACDLFKETYENTKHVDGKVSIEVDPRFAHDTQATIEQGKELWRLIDRPNLFIKVPATIEGLPAITQLIAEGISVNVTLIFSVERYKQVLAAYSDGLNKLIKVGRPVNEVFSVASFFVSRVDTAVDPLLPVDSILRGSAAISNAAMAYEAFQSFEASATWKNLKSAGCNSQRPLWASTGVKDPSYDPNRYVIDLIAPNTVNTMPEQTLESVKKTGVFKGLTINNNLALAKSNLARLALAGIDLDKITKELEIDGVKKFEMAWLELMNSVRTILSGV